MARARKLTPAERWERTADPDELYALLNAEGKWELTASAIARKKLLLVTGSVWVGLRDLPDAEIQNALAVADRLADGALTPDELRTIRTTVWRIQMVAFNEFEAARGRHPNGTQGADLRVVQLAAHRSAIAGMLLSALKDGASGLLDSFSLLVPYTAWDPWSNATEEEGYNIARTRLCGFVRDVLGNPFAPPVAFSPDWHTSAVTGLANTIYEDRAFDRLPVLADALEEAGCADPAILAHCRDTGEHIRGCWVIDGLAGRNWRPRI